MIADRTGTHRSRTPEETLAAIVPLLRVAGITRTAVLTGLDRIGLPVAISVRPNSRSISVSHGKGLTLAHAKASAQMEALECHVAEVAPRGAVLGTLAQPPTCVPVLDVMALPRASDAPAPTDIEVGFIKGIDLMTGGDLWAPEEVVLLDYALPMPSGHGWLYASSNGLASGNTFEEAVVHGLCEVIERACTTRWLANKKTHDETRIDLESVTDASNAALLAHLHDAGMDVWVWDQTGAVGLATFMCSIAETARHPLSRPLQTGMGCHPSRSIALSRAITEAVQTRMTFLAGARDDVDRAYFGPSASMFRPSKHPKGKSIFDVPDVVADTHQQEVTHILDLLAAQGYESVYAHSFPVEEILGSTNVAVVRVIVPGLPGPEDACNAHLGQPGELT